MHVPKPVLAILAVATAMGGTNASETVEKRDGLPVEGKYVGAAAGAMRAETLVNPKGREWDSASLILADLVIASERPIVPPDERGAVTASGK